MTLRLKPHYPLAGERLQLRPCEDADLDALYEIYRREDVARYLYTPPFSRKQTAGRLARARRQTVIDDTHDGLYLAAERLDSGGLVGTFTLFLASRDYQQGEIGYMLHPDQQGHGFATDGARIMLRLGFEQLGLHRIVARLDARNTASARVAERVGMRREAHLRENELVKGEWTDELIYALLAEEWRAGGMAR